MNNMNNMNNDENIRDEEIYENDSEFLKKYQE